MKKLPRVSQETIWECHNEVISCSKDTEPYDRMKYDNPYLAAFLKAAVQANGMNVQAMFAIAITMYDALDRQAEKDNLSKIYSND